MSHIIRRVAAAGAIALVAGVGATGWGLAAEPISPGYVSGLLALRTGTTSSVTLVDPATMTAISTQTLTHTKSCLLRADGAQLLDVTDAGSGHGPGLRDGSIGVRQKASGAGKSCAQVDASAGESLVVGIGADTDGLVASSASLDLDLKQNAQILATTSLAGTVTGYFELQSGRAIGSTPVDDATAFVCSGSSDSGPDSGTNDHCRWEISAPSWTGPDDGIAFDALTLTALRGSFSLEGGADGSVDDPDNPVPAYLDGFRYDSLFELVEGVLACGETATLRSNSSSVSSTWTRLPSGDCTPYPYSTSAGSDGEHSYAHSAKPPGEASGAAVWVTTFPYSGSVPTPTIDLEDGGGDQLLHACPESITLDGSWTPPSMPYACLVSVSTQGSGRGETARSTSAGTSGHGANHRCGGQRSATYTVYVAGDAWLRV